MPDITSLVSAGMDYAWIYLPLAVLLGALHALEPGHSKSMMAAFVVATHGTARQAALLGLSAAVGHTFIIWLLAFLGLWLGDALILDRAEPWIVLVSGLLILGLAGRIMFMFKAECGHDHAYEIGEAFSGRGHGHAHGHAHGHDHGACGCGHDHPHAEEGTVKVMGTKAREKMVSKKMRPIGWTEIVWFGFTGGLMPCPSALAVLLVCLQMKAFTLGFAMVAGFSVGLAATLVSVGVAAAWGADKAREGWSGFSAWSERIPYISAGIVGIIGGVMVVKGLAMLGVGF